MNIESLIIGAILLLSTGMMSACSFNTEAGIPGQHIHSDVVSQEQAARQRGCGHDLSQDGSCRDGSREAIASDQDCDGQNCLSTPEQEQDSVRLRESVSRYCNRVDENVVGDRDVPQRAIKFACE